MGNRTAGLLGIVATSMVTAILLLGPGGMILSPFGLGPTQVLAQTAPPMPASLLKRLGEAVDGYRTGQAVFVVADGTFPHHVWGVFPTLREAQVRSDSVGLPSYVYGPFVAPRDGEQQLFFIINCPNAAVARMQPMPYGKHRPDSYCPPTDSAFVVPIEEVQEIQLRILLRDGRIHVTTHSPSDLDAVFFTLSAVDKFAVPYYARLYGVDFAARMRAGLLELLGIMP